MAEPEIVEDEFEAVDDMVPDDGIPVAAWRVLTYIHPDGTEHVKFDVFGDPDITVTLGTVQWALNVWLREALEDDDDDDA